MTQKEYKPEPPKRLKEIAVARRKLDSLRTSVKAVLTSLDEFEDELDRIEAKYAGEPVGMQEREYDESGKDEVDFAIEDLLKD